MAEKKQYRATKDCFRDGRVIREGETFFYDGKPSEWMAPVEAPRTVKGAKSFTNDELAE